MYDIAIIGGGIVGLSVGWAITQRYPRAKILVLEKASRWGHHQTGHNSGEIHSGLYYEPGSLKATYCRAGNRAMVDFCREYGVSHEVCGKVIVAAEPDEIPRLQQLHERARCNGIAVSKLCREELKEVEPYCAGLAALHVPTTGIVEYQRVAETFAGLIGKGGGDLHLNTEVKAIIVSSHSLRIDSSFSTFESRFLINCAGLQSDRVAKLMGVRTGMRIIPIRGEYYWLVEEKQHVVKTLIYPVPNPRYPFLSVHFNRLMNGQVRAGPNAVISLQREGYHTNAFNLKDALELCGSKAFWKFAAANWREGGKELLGSLSKAVFVRRVQKLIPDIQADHLVGMHAGVRAQAVMDDGRIMDDFVILRGPRSIHVCNAPSPAATSSIPIGHAVVDRLQDHGFV